MFEQQNYHTSSCSTVYCGELLMTDIRGKTRFDEPMSRHSSWRVGGPAKQFFQPADLDDLSAFLRQLDTSIDVLWVGLGSNLLVRDGGFNGVVISLTGLLNQSQTLDEHRLYVESGLQCPRVARIASREQLGGAEFLAGIPGTMGGALAMNAGAFGGETWDIVHSVTTINRQGDITTRKPDDYQLGYRSVVGPEQEWFVACELQLHSDTAQASNDRIQELLQRRSETQPIGQLSCGSVFQNPPNDHAARLIEASGLKGFRIGGAVVSEKHANFIINDNQATAADLESVIQHVRYTVLEQHKVELQTEVRIVGNVLSSEVNPNA